MKRKKTKLSTRTQEMEVEQSNHQDSIDRLSSLPDPLVESILSLLPIKEAAATSILSHHYQHLWTQISRLDLLYLPRRCWIIDNEEGESFISTVNHIFELLTSNKIHTFHLDFPYFEKDDTQLQLRESALEKWFGYVCARNVEEIKVSNQSSLFNLPTCTFICPSLVVLEILDGFYWKLPDDGIINLPNLNKLVLHHLVDWDFESLSKLFSSCPVLEVLDLSINCYKPGLSMDISCQNLRSLTINAVHVIKGCNYIINAPNLETFDVNGGHTSFLFVEKPCLLTKAMIKTSRFEDVDVGYLQKMSALVKRICSVKSLTLTSIPLGCLAHSYGNIGPTFRNLSKLYICLNEATAGNNLLSSLHSAPNLEVLYIDKDIREKGVKWDVPYSVPICLSQKIRKIKAMGLEGSKEDLKFLEYILCNANVLKSVFVRVSSHSATQIVKDALFCKNLFTCPRISNTCRIDFQGGYLHASSTDNHSCAKSKLKCEIQL